MPNSRKKVPPLAHQGPGGYQRKLLEKQRAKHLRREEEERRIAQEKPKSFIRGDTPVHLRCMRVYAKPDGMGLERHADISVTQLYLVVNRFAVILYNYRTSDHGDALREYERLKVALCSAAK